MTSDSQNSTSKDPTEGGLKYDLFLSYSTAYDKDTSDQLESFLEGFHSKWGKNTDLDIRALQVCRDGSDFQLHDIRLSQQDAAKPQEERIKAKLTEYLSRCDHLLVLCSPGAVRSDYVNFEIDWFKKHKPDGKIYLAVTHGRMLDKASALEIFPQMVFDHQLDYFASFDFRGSKREAKAENWLTVKDYEDETIGLAAQLNGYSAGELLPKWKRLKERERKKRRSRNRVISLVILAVTIAIGFFIRDKVNESRAGSLAASARDFIEGEYELDKGLKALQEALKLDPDNPEAIDLFRKYAYSNVVALCSADLQQPDYKRIPGVYHGASDDKQVICTSNASKDSTYLWRTHDFTRLKALPGKATPSEDKSLIKTKDQSGMVRYFNWKGLPAQAPVVMPDDTPGELLDQQRSDELQEELYARFVDDSDYEYQYVSFAPVTESVISVEIESEIGNGYMGTEILLMDHTTGEEIMIGAPAVPDNPLEDPPPFEELLRTEDEIFFVYEDQLTYADLSSMEAVAYTNFDPEYDTLLNKGITVFQYDGYRLIQLGHRKETRLKYYIKEFPGSGRVADLIWESDKKFVVSTDDEFTYLWLDKRRKHDHLEESLVAIYGRGKYYITRSRQGEHLIRSLEDKDYLVSVEGEMVEATFGQRFAVLVKESGFNLVDLLKGEVIWNALSFLEIDWQSNTIVSGNDATQQRISLATGQTRFEEVSEEQGITDPISLFDQQLQKHADWPVTSKDSLDEVVLDRQGRFAYLSTPSNKLYHWDLRNEKLELVNDFGVIKQANPEDPEDISDVLSLELLNFGSDQKHFFIRTKENYLEEGSGENYWLSWNSELYHFIDGRYEGNYDYYEIRSDPYDDFFDIDEARKEFGQRVPIGCSCYMDPATELYEPFPLSEDHWLWSFNSWPAGFNGHFPESMDETVRIKTSIGIISKIAPSGEILFELRHLNEQTEFQQVFDMGEHVLATTSRGEIVIWNLRVDHLNSLYTHLQETD